MPLHILNTLKTLLSEGLSEPEFYGDLVYKFKKLKGINDFSFQFRKIITRYRRIGYNLNVMRQSACLVFNPIMVRYDTIRYILLESHFCTCKDIYSVQYIQYTDKTCTKPLNE